jgi:opacity protein-like surface antigen
LNANRLLNRVWRIVINFMQYRIISTLGILSGLLIGGSRQEGYAQYRQNPHFLPYSTVSFGGGTSTYFGDLAGYSQPIKSLLTLPRWNVGASYARQFTPRLGARVSFTWARITGDDYTFSQSDPIKFAPQYVRNLHFRNDLKEFAIVGTYDFIPGSRTPRERPKVTPYLLAGVALLAHNPQALTSLTAVSGATPDRSGQQWVSLQLLGTEGQGQPGYEKPYSLITVAIPVGLGVRYALNESWSISAEIRATPTFSDYLDDVGGNYPNPADLPNPLSQDFSNRAFISGAGGVAIKEPFAARTGDSRLDGINQIAGAFPSFDPFTQRGGGGRIPLRDSYLLTSFHIQYIIPTKIKCPPIR